MKSILVKEDPILTLRYAINELVKFDHAVIDVGAGLKGVYQGEIALRASRYVMIDAFEPYLRSNVVAQSGAPCEPKVGVLPQVLGYYSDDEFDVALAIDVIEHLTKIEALAAFIHLKRVAKCVALFTPEGWYPQHDHDEYHMGGELWQEHRCGWQADELEAYGFTVTRWEHFHDGWAPKGQNPNALWAVWRRT